MSNILLWRNRHGEYVNVRTMETKYLYHIVKMLWNNVFQPSHSFGDVIEWTFNSDTYSPNYLSHFFKHGLYRLRKRRNRAVANAFLTHVTKTTRELKNKTTRQQVFLTRGVKDRSDEMAFLRSLVKERKKRLYEVGQTIRIPATETSW